MMLKIVIFALLATAYGQQITEGTNIANPEDDSCTSESGEEGKCVMYYLCTEDNKIKVHGEGIVDPRLGGECKDDFVCCRLPDELSENKTITPTPPTPIPTPSTPPIIPTPPTPAPTRPPQVREGCGWRNPDGVNSNTNPDVNSQSKFGEFPWMVALFKTEPVNKNEPNGQKRSKYIGGGSLIHSNVVLTVAHYVKGESQLKVRVGEWDLQSENEIYPYQERDVNEVVTHKDFIRGNLFNDVALLFLSEPVDLSKPHIGVACLPPQGDRAIIGTRCHASGWGKNQFKTKAPNEVILKKVELPIVDRMDCQNRLRKTRLGRLFRLHSGFMCAGGEVGVDTCTGDGGSPLVCPTQYEKDRYIQNGIVSWGIGCGEDGTPGVYVDVANVRTWIDEQVRGHRYDPKTYTY